MKEIQAILEKISNFAPGEKAILATVVDVQGSGYRRPGARMLIDKNGYGIGTVSGGCLEADVLERAKKVLQMNEPTVITYDTTKDENSVFGLGMGCRGVVRILLEPVEKDSFIAEVFRAAIERRERQFVATLIDSNRYVIGKRILYNAHVDSPKFSKGVNKTSREAVEFYEQNRSAEVHKYKSGANHYEYFFENINPPLELKLFGVGYDALPLIKFAKELGWRVAAVDHRAAFANRERLAEADEIFVSNIHDLDDEFFEDANAVAVIMTHNYDRDREILPRLLRSNCLYVGALGPKTRTEKILAESGEKFSDEQLAKLHAPVGLDIGANSPEAIALSIVAEIQAVLSGRNGNFLRERRGSIYGRSE